MNSNIEITIGYATFGIKYPCQSIQKLSDSAMLALLIHNYLLNFSREVDLIWLQKFRLLSLLYILNYYPMVLNGLFSTILNSYTPQVSTAILLYTR